MFFGERTGNFRERGGHLIRLGGENQNCRGLGGYKIGRDGFCAGLGSKMFARRVKRIGGEKLVRLDELGVDKTSGERGGHLARAEKTDFKGCYHADFVTGGDVNRKRNSRLVLARRKDNSLCL